LPGGVSSLQHWARLWWAQSNSPSFCVAFKPIDLLFVEGPKINFLVIGIYSSQLLHATWKIPPNSIEFYTKMGILRQEGSDSLGVSILGAPHWNCSSPLKVGLGTFKTSHTSSFGGPTQKAINLRSCILDWEMATSNDMRMAIKKYVMANLGHTTKSLLLPQSPNLTVDTSMWNQITTPHPPTTGAHGAILHVLYTTSDGGSVDDSIIINKATFERGAFAHLDKTVVKFKICTNSEVELTSLPVRHRLHLPFVKLSSTLMWHENQSHVIVFPEAVAIWKNRPLFRAAGRGKGMSCTTHCANKLKIFEASDGWTVAWDDDMSPSNMQWEGFTVTPATTQVAKRRIWEIACTFKAFYLGGVGTKLSTPHGDKGVRK